MSEPISPTAHAARIQAPPARLAADQACFLNSNLQPSRALKRVCLGVFLLIAIALLVALIPLWRTEPFTALAVLLAGLAGLLGYARQWRSGWQTQYWRLRLDRDGWQLAAQDNAWQPVKLHGQALVWPQLLIVGFITAAQRRPLWLILTADSCDPAAWRQLRTWLLIHLSSSRPY